MLAKLTQKQQRFIDEYLISGNATQSYKTAGYSAKTDTVAAVEAYKLLRNPKIKAAVDQRNKEIQTQKTMDMREVMERLAAIARGQTLEEQVTNKGEIVKVTPKTSDQIKAMELIGKRVGAWTDRKDVNASLDIDIGVGDWDGDD